jgi:hypothetical protein
MGKSLYLSICSAFFFIIAVLPSYAMSPREQIVKQQLDIVESLPLEQLQAVPTPQMEEPLPVQPEIPVPKAMANEQGSSLNQQAEQPSLVIKEQTIPPEREMTTPTIAKTGGALVRRTHTFDMGADVYYSRYNEHDINVFLVGTMVGFYGNYTFRPPQGHILNNNILNVYRLEGHFAQGDLDYKGSGKDNGRANRMHELRGLAGKDYLLADGSRVTPYLGFGYRFLFDHGDSRFTSDGHIGYDRKSNYFYIPVGVFIDIPMSRNRELDFNLEYDFFMQGVQKSELSDIQPFTSGLTQDARNHQDKGFGIRGSVKFLKHYDPFDLYIEPFIRFWNIEDSKSIDLVLEGEDASGLEPHNTTTEVGSKFGIQF